MRKIEFQDAFAVARIVKKANLKNDIVEAFKKGSQGASERDIGIDVLFAVMTAAGAEGIDSEIYELLGSITGEGAETIKHKGIGAVVQAFKDIAQENDLESFFKLVQAAMK